MFYPAVKKYMHSTYRIDLRYQNNEDISCAKISIEASFPTYKKFKFMLCSRNACTRSIHVSIQSLYIRTDGKQCLHDVS